MDSAALENCVDLLFCRALFRKPFPEEEPVARTYPHGKELGHNDLGEAAVSGGVKLDLNSLPRN